MSDVIVFEGRDTRTVRSWEPGDGLICSSQSHSSESCGRPVAVIETVGDNSDYRSYRQRPIVKRRRIYCLRHLALKVESMESNRSCDNTYDSTLRRNALEELAVRNWDEFQDVLRELRNEQQAKALNILPDSLREQVLALDMEELKEGAA